MTAPAIDYYYAPISGFAYLGEPRLRAIAAEAGATVNYRPVDIAKVFAASETTPPFKQSPARLSYRDEDMVRWAKRLDMPLTMRPKHWPAPVDLACRAIAATDALGLDVAAASSAVLRAVWVEDRDVANPADLRGALLAADLDAEAILVEAERRRETVAAYTQAAIVAQVFGSPTYVVNGVRFWGQDRLDFVADALREGGA